MANDLEQTKNYPASLDVLDQFDKVSVDESYSKFLLSLRIWAVRFFYISLLVVFLWGYAFDNRVFLHLSFAEGWKYRLLAGLPLLLTFRYRQIHPLGIPWVVRWVGIYYAVFFSVVLNTVGFGLVFHLPMIVLMLMILLDEPLSEAIWQRYLGTGIAVVILLWQFLFAYADDWQVRFDDVRSLFFSVTTFTGLMVYFFHSPVFIHQQMINFATNAQCNRALLVRLYQYHRVAPAYFLLLLMFIIVLNYIVIAGMASIYNRSLSNDAIPFINLFAVLLIGGMMQTKRYATDLTIGLVLGGLIVNLMLGLFVVQKTLVLAYFYPAMLIFLMCSTLKIVRYVLWGLSLIIFIMPLFFEVVLRNWVVIIADGVMIGFVAVNLWRVRKGQLDVVGQWLYEHEEVATPLVENIRQRVQQTIKNIYSIGTLIFFGGLILTFISLNYANERAMKALSLELAEEVSLELSHLHRELAYINYSGVVLAGVHQPDHCVFAVDLDNKSLTVVSGTCQYSIDMQVLEATLTATSNQVVKTFENNNQLFLALLNHDKDNLLVMITPLQRWFDTVIQDHAFVDGFEVFLLPNGIDSGSRIDAYSMWVEQVYTSIEYLGQSLNFALGIRLNSLVIYWYWFFVVILLVVFVLIFSYIGRAYDRSQHLLTVRTELEQKNSQLQQIGLLSEELKQALDQAQQANMSKEKFLAVIGHEIRTPLNSVIGLLTAQSLQPQPPKLEALSKGANKAAHALLVLVNDILDYTKLQGAEFDIFTRPFSLNHFADQLAQQSKPLVEEKGLTFSMQTDLENSLVLEGDELRLRQIITNLVNNAVKFTQDGTVGLVFNTEIADSQCYLTIKVTDTGCGIREDDFEKVFEPFVQANMADTRAARGVGLGLAIVKQLLSRMGGEIDFVSKINRGTNFTVKLQLPIHTVADDFDLFDLQFEFADVDFQYPGARVLAVDDDVMNMMVIEELLEPYQVHVDSAQDAKQTLAFLKNHKYDFVLMDHQMPELTGTELAKVIRRTYDQNALPIIGLTADLSDKVGKEMFAVGMNDCLSKPLNLSSLLRLLDQYCYSRRAKTDQ